MAGNLSQNTSGKFNHDIAFKRDGHSVQSSTSSSGDIKQPPESVDKIANHDFIDHKSDRSNSNHLIDKWLDWQCLMISGVIRGAVFIYEPKSGMHKISVWPVKGSAERLLEDAAKKTLSLGSGLEESSVSYGASESAICDLVSMPITVEGKIRAVVVLIMSTRVKAQLHAIYQLLEWGQVWLMQLLNQNKLVDQNTIEFLCEVNRKFIKHENKETAYFELLNTLSLILKCDRMSLGVRKNHVIELKTISNISYFDKNSSLSRSIEKLMEEASDQKTDINFPADDEGKDRVRKVTSAHQKHSQVYGMGHIYTLPIVDETIIGAISCERKANLEFSESEKKQLNELMRLIGPIITIKENEEPLRNKLSIKFIKHKFNEKIAHNINKNKFKFLFALAIFVSLMFIDKKYQVKADANIQGSIQQLLVSPFDGYISQSSLRAGDVVNEGDLLAQLDQKNLLLEKNKWLSEEKKLEKEFQSAFAKKDKVELSLLISKIEQVKAELELVDNKINKSKVIAPFDGVVVKGDLSQSLGTPVNVGDVLFELAPLDNYRVIIDVDEYDVNEIVKGQKGHLLVSAFPDKPLRFTITSIVSAAVNQHGKNIFRAEAVLDQGEKNLRPGMTGVVKIDVGQKNIFWIFTHKFIDKLTIFAWKLGVWS